MHVKQGVGAAQLLAGILLCFSAHEYQSLLHMLFDHRPLYVFILFSVRGALEKFGACFGYGH